jgi:hypothetical protein
MICYSAYANDEKLQLNIAQLGGLEKENGRTKVQSNFIPKAYSAINYK